MQKRNQPEVVVITGATAGIGRAAARAFAQQGAHIALLARDQQGLDDTHAEIEKLGGKALSISVDVADAAQVEAAAESVEREFGPIDIWVNNAIVQIFAPLKEISAADFKRVTEVNYLGTVYGTMAALKRMQPRDKGVIVQIGSEVSYRSTPLLSAYCGSKFAVRGFTDSLRSELLHDNSKVRITMLHFPGINTPEFDWGKTTLAHRPKPAFPIYQPEVAARAIVWAAHHPRREMYVSLPAALMIWSSKLMPSLLDRFLGRFGYDLQQAKDTPISPNRPDNLWQPIAGRHVVHGSYSEQALKTSLSSWLNMHRGWLAVAGAGVVGLAWASQRKNRRFIAADESKAR